MTQQLLVQLLSSSKRTSPTFNLSQLKHGLVCLLSVMAGGEDARKRPALMRVKVMDKNYICPVKDYSEEIGSFCDRVLKKKVRVSSKLTI